MSTVIEQWVHRGRLDIERDGGEPDGRRRLAIVVTRFIAGAGGVALRGARALDPERWSVTIMCADGGPLIARAEESGFHVVRLRHMRHELSPREDAAAVREVATHLAEGGYDVVHTHSSKAGAIGRIAARRAGGAATVHTFHGFPFHDFQSAARRTAYIAVERRLGRITDRFVAVGSAVAADAVRLRIASPERIGVIPPFVDAEAASPTPQRRARARAMLGIPDGVPLVGTVGRLDHQKSPLDMVAAVARMRRRDARLVWIGDGPLRRETEEAVRRRGLEGRVVLAGERADVPDLLPGLDAFAMSSLYEGLPCAVVEAMLAGIPVAATAVNSVHEVVVPGATGLIVPPRAPALLARALDHLLDRPDEAARMARAATAHVGDRFHPRHMGPMLEETYRAAMAARSSPQAAPAVAAAGGGS